MKRQKVIDIGSKEKPKDSQLPLNWDNVLGEEEGEQVPELEIVGNVETPPATFTGDDDSDISVKSLKDHELEAKLKRQKYLLDFLGHNLFDKGEKIRHIIGRLEYEKQRRMFQPNNKRDADNIQTPVRPKSSVVIRHANTASTDTSRQGNTGTKEVSRSTFASHSGSIPKMDTPPVKLFNTEPQDLSRASWKSKADTEAETKQSSGCWSMPRLDKPQIHEKKFYSEYKDPKRNRKPNETSVKRKPRNSSPYVLLDNDNEDDVIAYNTPRESSVKASPSQGSSWRKNSDDQVINLDEDEDEEEPQSPMVAEEAFEIPEGLPESFCYPSWDDPDCVQVSLNDLKCLSPKEYLTSPIINFYIRFLQHQVFSGNQTAANSHFFNTFFYKKLTEALSYKGNDKDAFFVKFRRWWKGSDLFRKSYIFIPIHEDLHWSLVIICIPDKKEDWGLTLLHLDSLGLHPRNSIFTNVKRFLAEEWNYLKQDTHLLDLPISEKIWSCLPYMIFESNLQVPQQKNDFDCGLFVLFFIKQFIEEAPQRMTVKDLTMIHKKWFKPNEASSLRVKIRNKLIDLFRNSIQRE